MASADPLRICVLLLGQHHDAPALRGLIGQRGELGGIGQTTGADGAEGNKGGRLPVAKGDGTGLVEQQHIDVAGRLHRPSRQSDDVGLDHPVHPGDADGGKQSADGGRNETDQQCGEDRQGDRTPLPGRLDAEKRKEEQSHRRQQEDNGEAGQQDVEGDLVGGLLSPGPFDHGDHPVEKGLAGVGCDPHHQPVGEDLGTTGNGAPVTAALPDHRRALAGNGGLVH
jgi:hypothetical protein